MNASDLNLLQQFYTYCIAGREISINLEIPELCLYLTNQEYRQKITSTTPLLPPSTDKIKIVEGWLLDRFISITYFFSEQGNWLDIPGEGTYWISPSGESISLILYSIGSNLDRQVEALLGAPLVLALALQEVWCLHASAIEVNGELVAFMGESGEGKSTLAAFLAQQPGVKLASDDVLPIMLMNGSLFALPQFPQLKLPSSSQPAQYLPKKLPLSKIYLLKEQPSVVFESLSASQTALTLISHTVAARLFDEQLLSKHFEFCGQISSQVQLQTFAYPRVYSQLPNVVGELLADISKKVA